MSSRDSHSHWVPAGSNTCLTQKPVRPLRLHRRASHGLLSEQSRRWTTRSSCLLLTGNYTLCEASIPTEFRLWDTRSQEYGFSHRQVSELTIQQSHLLARHSPSRKSETSQFLDPTKFHREQVRKLPSTGARFHLLRNALAMTSQLCGSQELWESTGGQKKFIVWGEAALLGQWAPSAYTCHQM